MAIGGINVQPSLAPYPGVASGTPAVSASPIDGQQAGSVEAAGGDVSIPRTAAIAAHVGNTAMNQQRSAAEAQAVVDTQQVVDPSNVQAQVANAATPSGPAAWNDDWASKFREIGAPSELIQQLTFSGAMGADEAQLQQMFDQVKGEIDTQLAQFNHEHPEAFKKLWAAKELERSMVVQIAMASNAGQLPEEQLEQTVASIGKSGMSMIMETLKPMLVWSLIPGWGAMRLGFAPFTGGKDPLTGERMFGSPMESVFTVLAGVGGGVTLYQNARGAMQVAQGHRLIAQAGSDAATIAAREGLDNITGFRKFLSYVPGTELNQQVAGLSRLDDIKSGIANLKGIQHEIATDVYSKVVNGDVLMWGDSASKWSKMGYQPNHRGFVMGHLMGKKGATSILTNGSRPTIMLDSRTFGQNTAAHLAADGLSFVDDTVANGMLKTRAFAGLDPSDANVLKSLREVHLGTAGEQLLAAGAIQRPTGMSNFLGKLRPGALQDTLWAVDNVSTGSIGAAHGFSALKAKIPLMSQWQSLSGAGKVAVGLGGATAAILGIKAILGGKAKDSVDDAQQQDAAGGQAPGGTGSLDASQLSAEDQAVLQQFAAMPADQQAQIIEGLYTQLQQAMQTPNMTAEQQQQVASAQAELQLLMQVAQAGTSAASAAAQPAAATAPAVATAPTAAQAQTSTPAVAGAQQPTFTAQGLGLA